MLGRNQLGRQDSQCVCEQVGEFLRGGEVAKSLRTGRMVRRAIIAISDIRMRSESDPRSRKNEGGIPVRIINGWRGEDLVKMVREERPREEYARGWMMPNDRRGGISTNRSGGTIMDEDVVEGDSVEEEKKRWGNRRNKSEKKAPQRNAIPQHRRFQR